MDENRIIDTAKEGNAKSPSGNTSLLRVGVIFLAVVSFFTTANGMKEYIFRDHGGIAYAASAAVQSILLALSMNLPKYLAKVWDKKRDEKKNPGKPGKVILCIIILSLTAVTIFCSSWFSYVYIAEVIHQDSWDTDSELLVQQTYRAELYSARDYAHAYRTYLEESVGEDILLLERQAQEIEDSDSSIVVDWSQEEANYLLDNGTAASYMSPVILAMRDVQESNSQESRDLAAIAIEDAKVNISERILVIQENLDRINRNLANYNTQLTSLTNRINNATEETDIAPLNNAVANLTQLINDGTQQQIALQRENAQLDNALLRLPFYESILGLSNSSSSISIRRRLIQMQAEFFNEDPNDENLMAYARDIFDDLRNAASAVANDQGGTTSDEFSYTNLLIQMNRLIRNLTDYSGIKDVESNLDELIADLRTISISESEKTNSQTNSQTNDQMNDQENGQANNQEDGQEDGQTDDQANGQENGQANDQANGQENDQMDDQANGQENGQTNNQENGQEDGQTDDQANGQENGQANDQANGQEDGQTDDQANGQENGQANDQANGQENGQTNNQTNGEENGQTNNQDDTWQTEWRRRLENLKAQISSLPIYSETAEAGTGTVKVLTESQINTLRGYNRSTSSAALDEMLRRYISKHNAIYQGIIYLTSPYKMLAIFALCLALAFDLSGFVFGFVMQGETQNDSKNEAQKDSGLRPSYMPSISSSSKRGNGKVEWSILDHYHQYRVLTGDFTRKDGTYYYKVFRDGLAEQLRIKDSDSRLPCKQGIYMLKENEAAEDHGVELAEMGAAMEEAVCAGQELLYSGQDGGPQDGVFAKCSLIYKEGGLSRQDTDRTSFICSLEEYVPVHCYSPAEKENRTFPINQLVEKRELKVKIAVVALNKEGTRVSAIYIIKDG